MLLKVVRSSAFFVCAAALVFSFIGCDNGSGSSGPTIETIRWEQDSDGFYQFKTNDKENCWKWFSKIPVETSGNATKEIIIKKESGESSYGFGIHYDYHDKDNYHRVVISRYGSYRIEVQDEDVITHVTTNWTSSDALNTGFGAENKITITESSGVYKVYFNDSSTPVHTYNIDNYGDIDSFPVDYNGVGAVVIIGKQEDENFPGTPVDIRFKVTQPQAAP